MPSYIYVALTKNEKKTNRYIISDYYYLKSYHIISRLFDLRQYDLFYIKYKGNHKLTSNISVTYR